jgi:hypothetical protein
VRRLAGLTLTALLGGGCLTPRSIMVGQMAAPIGKGAAEIGLGAGVGYAAQSGPIIQNPGGGSTQQLTKGFGLPTFEGNAHFGFGDHLGLNMHVSSAGIQPGVKITVNKSQVAHFALMPQAAIGYASFGQANYVAGTDGVQMETTPTWTTAFTFMIGLRVMVSHRSGFYASVGYDFIATRSTTNVGASMTSSPTSTLNTSLQHQLAVNVGFTVAVNWLRIRPEIAVGILPAISSSTHSGGVDTSGYGGYGFVILPGFSLVAVTPKVTKDEGAEEDEKNVGAPEEKPREEEKAPERDSDTVRDE